MNCSTCRTPADEAKHRLLMKSAIALVAVAFSSTNSHEDAVEAIADACGEDLALARMCAAVLATIAGTP